MSQDFLQCMDKIFICVKWIGIPVYSTKIALCWSFTVLLLFICLEACAVWKLFGTLTGITVNSSSNDSLVAKLSGSIFYANGLISLILTWRFVGAWKAISYYWWRIDLTTGLNITQDKFLKGRLIFVCKFIGICAFVEHLMSMIAAVGFEYCTLEECFRRYILSSHGFLIQQSEYHIWLAIPIFVLSKLATILWNLHDLIVILMSIGLTSRYHVLNVYTRNLIRRDCSKKNMQVRSKIETYLHVEHWRNLRQAYACQANLVRILDKRLGPLVLLSNMNNLYFICLQLYLGIRIMNRPWISGVYYIVSLVWLLFRACGVVLAAAGITVHSQRSLPYLLSCPSSIYNVEIKRLINQLTYDSVGLSGMGLFFLSWQSLLEVFRVVLKYELILLQYDK